MLTRISSYLYLPYNRDGNHPILIHDSLLSAFFFWRILQQQLLHLRPFAMACYGRTFRHRSSFESTLKPFPWIFLNRGASSDCISTKNDDLQTQNTNTPNSSRVDEDLAEEVISSLWSSYRILFDYLHIEINTDDNLECHQCDGRIWTDDHRDIVSNTIDDTHLESVWIVFNGSVMFQDNGGGGSICVNFASNNIRSWYYLACTCYNIIYSIC